MAINLDLRDRLLIGEALRIAYDEKLKRKEPSDAADIKRLGTESFLIGWTTEESTRALEYAKKRAKESEEVWNETKIQNYIDEYRKKVKPV